MKLKKLIPKQNTSFCSGLDECVDESPENNKIQCVKCNRLLTKFDLVNQMLVDSNHDYDADFKDNLKKENSLRNKLSEEECSKINTEISTSSINALKDLKEIFKCSKESNLFCEILKRSQNRKNDLTSTVQDSFLENYEIKPNEIFSKREIYSSLITNSFEIKKLMLPNDNIEQMIPEDVCSSFNQAEVIKFIIGIALATSLILLCLILFYFSSFREIPKMLFCKRFLFMFKNFHKFLQF